MIRESVTRDDLSEPVCSGARRAEEGTDAISAFKTDNAQIEARNPKGRRLGPDKRCHIDQGKAGLGGGPSPLGGGPYCRL